MGFARRISARWGIADRMQVTGEARLCEKLRKIEALFVENSAAARFRARARGVWLRSEALASELRCGGTSRDGGSGPTGRWCGECRINRLKIGQDGSCVDHARQCAV